MISFRWFFRIMIFLAIAMLVSCSSYHAYQKNSASFTTCKRACTHRLQQCQLRCHRNAVQCSNAQEQLAIRNYKRYEHQQAVQGVSVALQCEAFRDPLKCRKVTCDCTEDRRVCLQFCSGQIRKRLQVEGIKVW